MKLITGTFRKAKGGDPDVAVALTHARPDEHRTYPEPVDELPDETAQKIWDAYRDKLTGPWVTEQDQVVVDTAVGLHHQLIVVRRRMRELKFRPEVTNVTTRPNGEKVITVASNPLIESHVKLARELRAYLGLLGMTPADRSRVVEEASKGGTRGVNERQPMNPLERFIAKARQRG